MLDGAAALILLDNVDINFLNDKTISRSGLHSDHHAEPGQRYPALGLCVHDHAGCDGRRDPNGEDIAAQWPSLVW